MVTTAAALATYSANQVCYVLAFEGLNLLLTDTSDTAGIVTAWAATDWTTAYQGLEKPGSISQEINLFERELQADGQTFRFLDSNGALSLLFLRQQRTTDATHNWTTQTADIDSNDTTVNVKDTTGFASSGNIYWGSVETAAYGSKTGTTFASLTRGKWALFGTSSDATRFGRPHLLNTGDANVSTGDKPTVSDWPRVHHNRRVALYMHHYDLAAGTWSTKANAMLLWTGRMKGNPSRDHLGNLSFNCQSVHEELLTTIMANRFTGTLRAGMYLDPAWIGVTLQIDTLTVAVGATHATVCTLTNGEFSTDSVFKTIDEIASLVNEVMNAATSASATPDTTTVQLQKTEEQYRFQGTVPGLSATTKVWFKVGLHPRIWQFLGWTGSSVGSGRTSTGLDVEYRMWDGQDDGPHPLPADGFPTYAYIPVDKGAANKAGDATILIEVENIRGTSVSQPSGSIIGTFGTGVDVILKIGDKFFGAIRTSNSQYTIRCLLDGSPGMLIRSNDDALAEAWPETFEGDPPRVEQVWFEHGDAATIFLQLLLSTGTPAYNHATYDTYAAGTSLGLGIPYTLIDVDSFTAVLGSARYSLWTPGAVPFARLFNSICQLYDAALVWDWTSSKLTLRQVTSPAHPNVATVTLDSGNTASPEDRATLEYPPDAVINRATLKYGYDFAGSPTKELTINNLVSQSDYGQIKSLIIEAPGIYSRQEVDSATARMSAALALYGSTRAVVERSINATVAVQIAPGDTVLLTDALLVDPDTGTEGMTDRACLVLGTSWSPETTAGSVHLVMVPELDPDRIALWGPSARVDETSGANGGLGVDGKTLTLKTHEYSHSSEATDVNAFAEGDQIRIVELSAASPQSFSDEIDVLDANNNTIKIFNNISGTWDSSKRYVVEFDDYSTVTADQTTRGSWLADDTTGKISTNGDAYEWGPDPAVIGAATDFTTVYQKKPSAAAAAGDPNSCRVLHDALDGLVCISGWRTPLINEQFGVAEELRTATTTRTLVYGPVKIPLYHAGDLFGRALKCVAFVKTSAGTATVRFTLSSGMPTGSSTTSFTFPDGGNNYAEVTTTSTTYVYTSEGTIGAPVMVAGSPPHAWLSVDIVTSSGTVTLAGLTVYEAAP